MGSRVVLVSSDVRRGSFHGHEEEITLLHHELAHLDERKLLRALIEEERQMTGAGAALSAEQERCLLNIVQAHLRLMALIDPLITPEMQGMFIPKERLSERGAGIAWRQMTSREPWPELLGQLLWVPQDMAEADRYRYVADIFKEMTSMDHLLDAVEHRCSSGAT